MGGPPIHRLLRHLEPPRHLHGGQVVSLKVRLKVGHRRSSIASRHLRPGRLGTEAALAVANSRANRATDYPGRPQHLAESYGRPGSGLLSEEVSRVLPRAAKCSAVRRNQAATDPATTTWSNAAATLNLRPPLHRSRGEQIPRSRIARSATTVRSLAAGPPSSPCQLGES
jgi:hypothetical protein